MYLIEQQEPVDTAIRRVMDELIVSARDQLTDPKLTAEKRVHEARKRFKEARAVIRLVREPLGAHYPIENAWFRDAGRDLAAARDADAVLEALTKLEAPRRETNRAKRILRSQQSHPPVEGLIANTVDQLVIAQARLALWPAMEDSFETLAGGLLKAYRDGRRAAQGASTAEELHEWRKSAKTHWYHVQLLAGVWPEMMETYARTLHSLSRALGDHHDLHVLASLIGEEGGALAAPISERQKELEKTARELGSRLYAERPRAWLARMRNTWSAWRDR